MFLFGHNKQRCEVAYLWSILIDLDKSPPGEPFNQKRRSYKVFKKKFKIYLAEEKREEKRLAKLPL